MKNNDDKVRALENSLFKLDGETSEVVRTLVESCSAEEDDYLREQLYRTICTTYVRQGNIDGLEDAVAQWMDATSLTLYSALWAAQILRLVERPHLALEVLLPFASSDWHTKSGSARLRWIELLVQVLHELDDTLTAVDVCDKIMALGKSFGASQEWLSDTDVTSAAAFYGCLTDVYLCCSRIHREYDRQVIEYSERQKAAFFSRGLEAAPQHLAEQKQGAYRTLVKRLSELEAASAANYRSALAANPFQGRLTRGGSLSMLDSHTIVTENALLAEREREREMEFVRRELLVTRSKWPTQPAPWDLSIVGEESVCQQMVRIGGEKKVVSLVYLIDRTEEAVLIFLIDSTGVHERFTSDISIPSVEALIFMLDHYPTSEFDYIISSLSEILLPNALCDRLEKLNGATLLVSADSTLSGVPWEGLGRGRWRLGTCFALTNTPSLLTPCRQIRRISEPLVGLSPIQIIADPTQDLPGALREGYEIRRLLRERGIASDLDGACSSVSLLKALEDCSLIHFAGHTVFSRQDPASSALLLRDRALTAIEIGSTSIDGAVIVLSSCSSGRGGLSKDIENPFGVCNSFLLAGATAVIATNWLSEDGSSDWMMASFYRAVLNHPQDPLAETLRRLRNELFEDDEPIMKWAIYSLWGHPFVRVQSA